MSLQDKLQKISSPNKSNWVEDTGKELAQNGVRRKARRIALRVLQILKEKNITQTELAQRMGVSRQQVTKIVKGQENITLETIDKIEQALDVTLITVNYQNETPYAGQYKLNGTIPIIRNRGTVKSITKISSSKKSERTTSKFSVRGSWIIHMPFIKWLHNTSDFDKYSATLETHDYSRS